MTIVVDTSILSQLKKQFKEETLVPSLDWKCDDEYSFAQEPKYRKLRLTQLSNPYFFPSKILTRNGTIQEKSEFRKIKRRR